MTDSFINLQSGLLRIFSWLIFLLPAVTLTTHYGIGVIEFAIFLLTIFYARPLWRQRAELFHSAGWIVIAFAFNLTVATASLLYFKFPPSSIDTATRQLLVMAAIGLIAFAKPKAEWFWHGLFVGTIGAAGFALYQRFGLHMVRAHGFHQTIMFGDIAMAMGLMSLACIAHFSKTRWAALPYMAFLAGLTGSVLSGSRGGWIALLLAFIPLYSYGKCMAGRKILAIALASIMLMTAACFVPRLGVGQRLHEVAGDIRQYRQGNPNSSVGTRLEMWKGAGKMFVAHPLIGVGRENFNLALKTLIRRGEVNPAVQEYQHAHNELFHALATEGVIGAIALLLLYGAPFSFFVRHVRRDDACRPYALAGLLLVVSFIDFGMTQVLFSHHIGTAFYALVVSVLAGLCLVTQSPKPS
jgi:O-antigen ligase